MKTFSKARFIDAFFILFLLAFTPMNEVVAQKIYNEYWTGVAVAKNFSRGITASIEPGWRLVCGEKNDKKLSNTNEYLIDAQLDYEFLKYFGLGLKYRYSLIKEEDEDDLNIHEIAFDLKAKIKVKRLKLQLRTRFLKSYGEDGVEYFSNPYLRYRFKAEYKIAKIKLSPFAGVEVFHQLDAHTINKVRYSGGIAYAINKNHSLSFGYYYQEYLKKERFRHIYALAYEFTLP